MDCPRCGLKNPDEMNYCGRCGEKLIGGEGGASKDADSSRSRICVECGRDIVWYANVCPFCGHYYGSMCLPGSSVKQPTWKPVIGGLLCILSASLIMLSVFGLSGFGYGYYPYYYYYSGLIILILVLPPVAIAGGICATARRYWLFSLIGGICSVVISLLPFSVIYIAISVVGVMLIGSSQGEFKK